MPNTYLKINWDESNEALVPTKETLDAATSGANIDTGYVVYTCGNTEIGDNTALGYLISDLYKQNKFNIHVVVTGKFNYVSRSSGTMFTLGIPSIANNISNCNVILDFSNCTIPLITDDALTHMFSFSRADNNETMSNISFNIIGLNINAEYSNTNDTNFAYVSVYDIEEKLLNINIKNSSYNIISDSTKRNSIITRALTSDSSLRVNLNIEDSDFTNCNSLLSVNGDNYKSVGSIIKVRNTNFTRNVNNANGFFINTSNNTIDDKIVIDSCVFNDMLISVGSDSNDYVTFSNCYFNNTNRNVIVFQGANKGYSFYNCYFNLGTLSAGTTRYGFTVNINEKPNFNLNICGCYFGIDASSVGNCYYFLINNINVDNNASINISDCVFSESKNASIRIENTAEDANWGMVYFNVNNCYFKTTQEAAISTKNTVSNKYYKTKLTISNCLFESDKTSSLYYNVVFATQLQTTAEEDARELYLNISDSYFDAGISIGTSCTKISNCIFNTIINTTIINTTAIANKFSNILVLQNSKLLIENSYFYFQFSGLNSETLANIICNSNTGKIQSFVNIVNCNLQISNTKEENKKRTICNIYNTDIYQINLSNCNMTVDVLLGEVESNTAANIANGVDLAQSYVSIDNSYLSCKIGNVGVPVYAGNVIVIATLNKAITNVSVSNSYVTFNYDNGSSSQPVLSNFLCVSITKLSVINSKVEDATTYYENSPSLGCITVGLDGMLDASDSEVYVCNSYLTSNIRLMRFVSNLNNISVINSYLSCLATTSAALTNFAISMDNTIIIKMLLLSGCYVYTTSGFLSYYFNSHNAEEINLVLDGCFIKSDLVSKAQNSYKCIYLNYVGSVKISGCYVNLTHSIKGGASSTNIVTFITIQSSEVKDLTITDSTIVVNNLLDVTNNRCCAALNIGLGGITTIANCNIQALTVSKGGTCYANCIRVSSGSVKYIISGTTFSSANGFSGTTTTNTARDIQISSMSTDLSAILTNCIFLPVPEISGVSLYKTDDFVYSSSGSLGATQYFLFMGCIFYQDTINFKGSHISFRTDDNIYMPEYANVFNVTE